MGTGNVLLRVNTTNAPIDTVVRVGGEDLPVTFDSPEQVFRLSISGGSLTIGGYVTIEGDFEVSPTSFARPQPHRLRR